MTLTKNVLLISRQLFKGSASYDSNAVFYKLTSNQAKVFAIGSVRWAWGIDEFGQSAAYGHVWKTPYRYNVNAEILTRNVLNCLRDGGAACGS